MKCTSNKYQQYCHRGDSPTRAMYPRSWSRRGSSAFVFHPSRTTRRWPRGRVEGTRRRLSSLRAGPVPRAVRRSRARLRLSFVTRQPWYWYARQRHPRTLPPLPTDQNVVFSIVRDFSLFLFPVFFSYTYVVI